MVDPDKPRILQGFCADVTEVTVAAYRKCLEAGRCPAPDAGGFCNWGLADREDHPVNCVDLEAATAYCAFAGKRLPTSHEWTWAACGMGAGWEYPWGTSFPADNQLCWKRFDPATGEGYGTCPVGSYPSGDSPAGLADLAGNVHEWTSSRFLGMESEEDQSVRGGSWEIDPRHSNATTDLDRRFSPWARDPSVGFRCFRDAPGPGPADR